MNDATEIDGAAAIALSVITVVWSWIEQLISSIWTGLGWPHAVLIIFLISISCYRQEMKALIERVLEFGPSGVKLQPPVFQPASLERAAPSNAAESLSASAGELLPPPPNKGIPMPSVIVFPEQMKFWREGILSEVADMSDAEAKSYLIPMLALSRSMWTFEFCYSNIFGGQIRLLHILNQRIGKSVSVQEINTFWAAHQEQTKPVLDLWTADQYLSYLIQNGLIEKQDELITLTRKGAEFILWLTHFGRPLDRPW